MSIVQPLPLQSEALCVCARPYSARWLGPARGHNSYRLLLIICLWLSSEQKTSSNVWYFFKANLLSRQDPLKQLCVVCACCYLRDQNNDFEIKLSHDEDTMLLCGHCINDVSTLSFLSAIEAFSRFQSSGTFLLYLQEHLSNNQWLRAIWTFIILILFLLNNVFSSR